jgi:hypothetical protein
MLVLCNADCIKSITVQGTGCCWLGLINDGITMRGKTKVNNLPLN